MIKLLEHQAQGWVKTWDGGALNLYTGQVIAPIRGGAAPTNVYGGAHDIRDLQPDVQINAVGQRIVADYLVNILEEYNSQWDEIRATMLGPTITEYRLGIEREAGAMYLQQADEYSRPDAFRLGGRTFLQWPLRPYQRRTAWTRTYLARATVGDLLRLQQALSLQDTNTQIRDALWALLNVDGYTFDDEMYGPLTIAPFLNGDGFIPPPFFGTTFDGNHTHYMATNGALVEADIMTTAMAHLREHGMATNLIAWCDPNLTDEIGAFTNFKPRPDPNIIIPSFGGTQEYAVVTEADAIGRLGQVQIVPKPFMPANYIFIWDASLGPPLLERVHEVPEFRGFNLVLQEEKFPLRDAFYERWTGYAVNNRINGFAIFVDAGASYVTPATLTSAFAS